MTSREPPQERDLSAVDDRFARLQRFTPARIGLGQAGAAQPTAASLKFMLDHARARDAVHAALDFEGMAEALHARGWTPIHVRAPPAIGLNTCVAQISGESVASGRSLVESRRPSDVAVVAADGLSSSALQTNLLPTLEVCDRFCFVGASRSVRSFSSNRAASLSATRSVN